MSLTLTRGHVRIAVVSVDRVEVQGWTVARTAEAAGAHQVPSGDQHLAASSFRNDCRTASTRS